MDPLIKNVSRKLFITTFSVGIYLANTFIIKYLNAYIFVLLILPNITPITYL